MYWRRECAGGFGFGVGFEAETGTETASLRSCDGGRSVWVRRIALCGVGSCLGCGRARLLVVEEAVGFDEYEWEVTTSVELEEETRLPGCLVVYSVVTLRSGVCFPALRTLSM